MWQRLRVWLAATELRDPIEQRQAPIVQVFLLTQILVMVLGFLISMMTIRDVSNLLFSMAAYSVTIGMVVVSIRALRRGKFTQSILIYALGAIAIMTTTLVMTGIVSNPSLMMLFMVPTVFTGLLRGRASLVLVISVSSVVLFTVLALEIYAPGYVPIVPPVGSITPSIITSYISTILLVGVCLDHFGGTLRQALTEARGREHELQQLHAGLEQTVADRTADLTAALRTVEQREARLSQMIEEMHAKDTALRQMSAPVLPVLPGVLVAPLVGMLDRARAEHFTTNVLTGVERGGIDYVLMDVTGVLHIDSDVAQTLMNTAAAVRLLGARVALVGVRPEVAQTLVGLGIDLRSLTPYLNLQEAITALTVTTARGKPAPVFGARRP